MSPVSSRHVSVDFDNPLSLHLARRSQSESRNRASMDLDVVLSAGRMNSCEAEAKARDEAQVLSNVTVSVSDDGDYMEGDAPEEATGGEPEWQTHLDVATNR